MSQLGNNADNPGVLGRAIDTEETNMKRTIAATVTVLALATAGAASAGTNGAGGGKASFDPFRVTINK